MRDAIDIDPCESPPAFVVILAIDEAGSCLLRERQGIGEDEVVVVGRSDASVVGEDGDGVGGVPPACGFVEAGVEVVPTLEGLDGQGCVLIVRICRGAGWNSLGERRG